MTENESRLRGRWLVVALVVFYPLVLYGGGSLKDNYSHISQFISELNAVGSTWSWQIGYLGFAPVGVLGFLVLFVVAPHARLAGISQVGYWMLGAEPIAYLGSALAPCDLGCPIEGSLSQNIHNLLSLVTLPVTTFGLVFLSFNKRLNVPKRMGWLFLAAAFITLYTLALLPDLAPWRGLLQRTAEGTLYGCLCVVSWHLLGAHNKMVKQYE